MALLVSRGAGRRGGVATRRRCPTTPGLARPWGFPAPGGPGPGHPPGPRSRRPVVCQLGVGHGGRLGVSGHRSLVCCGGIHFHKVPGQLHSRRRRASRGPRPGSTHHPTCGCGPFGAPPRAGASARRASVGRRRRSWLPRPSRPVVLDFGEWAGAMGLRCCSSGASSWPFRCGGSRPREGGVGCSAGRAVGGGPVGRGRNAWPVVSALGSRLGGPTCVGANCSQGSTDHNACSHRLSVGAESEVPMILSPGEGLRHFYRSYINWSAKWRWEHPAGVANAGR